MSIDKRLTALEAQQAARIAALWDAVVAAGCDIGAWIDTYGTAAQSDALKRSLSNLDHELFEQTIDTSGAPVDLLSAFDRAAGELTPFIGAGIEIRGKQEEGK